jgi:hypothetical protein
MQDECRGSLGGRGMVEGDVAREQRRDERVDENWWWWWFLVWGKETADRKSNQSNLRDPNIARLVAMLPIFIRLDTLNGS